MFVGEKLTDIRVLHGYSRNELATILGVSEQSVWQYENGYATPGIQTMNKLREIFKVRTKFFYTEQKIENDIKEEAIAYRSSERNSIKKTKTETIHLKYLNYLVDYIEQYVEYPINNILKLREFTIKEINNNNGLNEGLIKEISLQARQMIGLENENNEGLLFLLEKNGAFIFEKSLGIKTDAYSAWTKKSNRPFIILGNFKKSSVRRNFDLAHELGHLILHYGINILELTTKEYEKIEKEANLFAANFLLPEEMFKNDIECIQKKSNPNSYIELKEKWKVSIAAIAYRAYKLNFLSYQQYRYFNVLLNRFDYKVKEPLDDSIPILRPGKIRNSLKFIFDNNLANLESLCKYSLFEMELISNLFEIEQDFFNDYIMKPKLYDFAKRAK